MTLKLRVNIFHVLFFKIALGRIPKQTIQEGISTFAKTGNGLGHAFTKLDVNSKEVENIQPLSSYIHLRHVVKHPLLYTLINKNISKNSIVDIRPLESMQYLLYLDASGNRIKNVPVELDGKPFLQYVDISQNEITTIQITNLPTLSFLNLNSNIAIDIFDNLANKLTDLILNDFPSLIHFECRANEIETITKLNTLKLEKLYIVNQNANKN